MRGKYLLTLLLLPLVSSGTGDTGLDRATMRGLRAVNIVLDALDPAVTQQGVTQSGLQDIIKAHLQSSHISYDPNVPEFVSLRITSVKAGRGPLAFALTMGLYQPVTLARDPAIRTATKTWEVEAVLMADSKQVSGACKETTGDLAAQFVTAYRSVNPAR